MPANDNILVQVATVGVSDSLPDPPAVEDVRLAAWMHEVRRVVEEHMATTQRSLLAIRQFLSSSVVETATNYTATDDDDFIYVDTTGGNRTVSLPLAADVPFHVFTIKNDGGGNTVHVDCVDAGDSIDGVTTSPRASIPTSGDAFRFRSLGTTEYKIF